MNCAEMQKLTIANSVTSIGPKAFLGCSNLHAVNFGTGLTFIGTEAFKQSGDGQLSIELPPSLATIAPYAFSSVRAASVTIQSRGSASTLEIQHNAFNCQGSQFLKSVTVNDAEGSTVTIGTSAFSYCPGLVQVSLGTAVRSIASTAFFESGRLSVSIAGHPDGTTMQRESFRCSPTHAGVERLRVRDSINGGTVSIGEYAFADCTGLLEATFGSALTSIGALAFSGAHPRSVSIIGGTRSLTIGQRAFACTATSPLRNVTIDRDTDGSSSVSIGYEAFRDCTMLARLELSGTGVRSIGSFAFAHSPTPGSGRLELSIPSSVAVVDAHAFEGAGLFSAIIFAQSIRASAFQSSSLTTARLGNSVTSIGSKAFANCVDLERVEIATDTTSSTAATGIAPADMCDASPSCEVVYMSGTPSLPPRPPPPLPPPPSPPPPAHPHLIQSSCAPSDPCSLEYAAAAARAPSAEGLPLVLRLSEGIFELTETITFDARTRASRVELIGTGAVVLQASPRCGTACQPMLKVGVGSPPVELRALRLHSVLRIENGTVEINQCVLEHSHGVQGGVLQMIDGELIVRGSNFTNNSARLHGGALQMRNGNAYIEASRFAQNEAGGSGGAIDVLGGRLTLAGGTALVHNRAALSGGALMLHSGAMAFMTNRAFAQDNHAQYGASLHQEEEGALTYGLPSPLGTWVASSVLCQRVYNGAQLAERQDQPCNWDVQPLLLGLYTSQVQEMAVDQAFPFDCPPGVIGVTAHPADQIGDEARARQQSTPFCADSCPAGHVCKGRTAALAPDTVCPARSYCPKGSSAPLSCPPGTFNLGTGAASSDACLTCEPGFWCAGGDRIPCAKNTFNAVESRLSVSQSACNSCPGNSSTNGQSAAKTISECLCYADFYNSHALQGGVHCETCPSGSSCGIGTTLESLPIQRGYYRRNSLSTDVRRCPDASMNCSSAPECPESTSGCRGSVGTDSLGTNGSSNLCQPTLTGPFCQLCETSMQDRVYYSKATESQRAVCKPCEGTLAITIGVLVGVVLGLGLAAVLLTRSYARLSATRKESLTAMWLAIRPRSKLKVVISFYMIATRIDTVYEVELPWRVRRLLAAFSFAVSFNLNDISTPLACLGLNGYLVKLFFWLIAPMVAAAMIVLLAALRMFIARHSSPPTKKVLTGTTTAVKFILDRMPTAAFTSTLQTAIVPAKPELREQRLTELALPYILYLFFFVYPIVTVVAFEAWPCHSALLFITLSHARLATPVCWSDGHAGCMQRTDLDDVSFLRADVSVECGSDYHRLLQAVAWVAVLLYPIGLIIVNAALLYVSRRAIWSGVSTPLSRAIRFLYSEYEMHLMWWELVEMVRRLVLVGLLVPLQGSTFQLILGTLFALIFLLLQVQAQPYQSPFDDYLANACSFFLASAFLIALAFKQAALLDLPAIQGKMNLEQREVYLLRVDRLTVLFIVAVSGALLASSVIFLLQWRLESTRLRDEARAAKARRLRYLEGHKEVLLATLPPLDAAVEGLYPGGVEAGGTPTVGPFHIFLSHNWKHGQSEMRIVKTRLQEMLPDVSVFLDVDNLGGGHDHPHVDVSDVTLCYCTERWWTNKPCVRELVRAVLRKKKLVALLEPDPDKGGVSEVQGRQLLDSDDYAAKLREFMATSVDSWRVSWADPDLTLPNVKQLKMSLFERAPLVWHRLADMRTAAVTRTLGQSSYEKLTSPLGVLIGLPCPRPDLGLAEDVTMRLIAEQVLPVAAYGGHAYKQLTYMKGELVQRTTLPLKTLELTDGCAFHLYISPYTASRDRLWNEIIPQLKALLPELKCTDKVEHMPECERFLVLLTDATWSRPEASAAFAAETAKAMASGVDIQLLHEVPGVRRSDKRNACTFDTFFDRDSTPLDLVRAGLYSTIAMNLAGDEWQEVAVLKLALEVAKGVSARSNRGVSKAVRKRISSVAPADDEG